MKPKGREAGIMVSDFIDEKNGYLSLTKEEYVVVIEIRACIFWSLDYHVFPSIAPKQWRKFHLFSYYVKPLTLARWHTAKFWL